jgi:hypothetical protein
LRTPLVKIAFCASDCSEVQTPVFAPVQETGAIRTTRPAGLAAPPSSTAPSRRDARLYCVRHAVFQHNPPVPAVRVTPAEPRISTLNRHSRPRQPLVELTRKRTCAGERIRFCRACCAHFSSKGRANVKGRAPPRPRPSAMARVPRSSQSVRRRFTGLGMRHQ